MQLDQFDVVQAERIGGMLHGLDYMVLNAVLTLGQTSWSPRELRHPPVRQRGA